jgi:hypothetical protein
MARATQRQNRGLAAHALVWLFLGAMLFSLAYYKRSEKSWRDDTTYQLHAETIAFGAPLPWIGYTSVVASGAPPPIELLPDGHDYLPGMHVDLPRACVAVTIALGVAIVLFLAGWMTWPNLQRRGEVPSTFGSFAVAAAGALVGFVGPTEPMWIGAALGIGLLPLVITIACWRRASIVPIVITSGLGVLALAWTQRLTPLLGTRAGAGDFDLRQDVFAPAATFAIYVLIVYAVASVKRLVAR